MHFSRWQLAFILLFPLIPLGGITLAGRLQLEKFDRMQPFREVAATVVALDCQQRSASSITYAAGGKQLTRKVAGKRCRQLQLGQSSPIWMSEQQPGYVLIDPPEEHRKSLASRARFHWVPYPIMCVLVAYATRRRAKQMARMEQQGWP